MPCDESGDPRENSRYTTITTERLDVGSTIEVSVFGWTVWEVIEVRHTTRPLLGAKDRLGNDLPLTGTLLCRGVR